jgi:2-alkenal reductase
MNHFMERCGRVRSLMVGSALLLLALPLLGCGLATAAGAAPASSAREVEERLAPTSILVPEAISGEDARRARLYARANPAVVNVTVYARHEGQVVPLGQGSGFVYDEGGYIVTNDHVVARAEQVEVTFADGTILAAEVVGQDPHSDLAVLQVEALPARVPALPLGDMDELVVGQSVIAIGNPFGFEGTLTEGIISGLGRTIPALTPFSISQAIQTDAAINPGNSGGPLLNLKGEVIGVNAQIETDGASRTSSGVGFAVPVSIVRLVVPELIENGSYEWAWLGVRGDDVTPALVAAMDLPVKQGAYLAEVLDNGPADSSGLQGAQEIVMVEGRRIPGGGDVVTAVDGQPVRSFDDLLIYIALERSPGQEITLDIIREGRTRMVEVRLEARPDTFDE